MEHAVCRTSDLPVGDRRLYNVSGNVSVCVFNISGRYYALRNRCPHKGGPLCQGSLTGTTAPRVVPGEPPETLWVQDGEILRCPWHGWEFDVTTGASVFQPPARVRSYAVRTEDGAPVTQAQSAERYTVRTQEEWIVVDVP